MLVELKNKEVTIHYSPIEGFASLSKGTIVEVSDKWIKLKSPGKKQKVNCEYIQVERILKIVLADQY